MIQLLLLTWWIIISLLEPASTTTMMQQQHGEWWKCGKILLPDHYSIHYDAASSKQLELAVISHSIFNQLETSLVRVQVLRYSGDLLCKCWKRMEDITHPIQVSLPLLNGTSPLTLNISLPVVCAETTALCRTNPTEFLLVHQHTKVRLLQRGMNGCVLDIKGGFRTSNHREREVSGIIVDPGIVVGDTHCNYASHAKLELISSFYGSNDNDTVLLLQVIPFDIASCAKYGRSQHNASSSIPLVISLQQSPVTLHKQPLLVNNFNVPDIHDVGDTKAPLSHLRVARQANHPPRFITLNAASISENVPMGSEVATVCATDEDEGTNGRLSYYLTSDMIHSRSLFYIEMSSGIIRTRGFIDRERWSEHVFTVTVTDGGGLSETMRYIITVVDQNDNTPTFQDGLYFNIAIPENTEVSSTIMNFSLVDEDSDLNGLIHCELVNSTNNTFSVISGLQFTLLLSRPLDYETIVHYHMTVIARDGGTPSRSSSAIIDIQVTNVVESTPLFNASSYSVVIPEDTPPGSTLIQVYASSPDSSSLDEILYQVAGGNNTLFRLGEELGSLVLAEGMFLDYEVMDVHRLTMQARYRMNPELHSEVSVVINVRNVNEHVPVFSRTEYEVLVKREEVVGTYVTSVIAEDADRDSYGEVTYSFTSNSEFFSIEPSTGVVSIQRVLDRSHYSFTISATDRGNRSSQANIMIQVIDSNNARPVFTAHEYRVNISANNGILGHVIQLHASDSDTESSQLVYSIQSGNTENSFSIANNGSLQTRGSLSRDIYRLVVMVSDGMLESNAVVHINVLDINNETPQFQLDLYTQSVPEGLVEGEEVLRVTADDGDEGSNGHVTYTLMVTDIPFSVDVESGILRVKEGEILDYELSTRTFSFTVVATDDGQIPRSSSAQVVIHLLDVNDNPPRLDYLPIVLITENLPVLTPVLQVSATDVDSAVNSQVVYQLLGDVHTHQSFGIREDTGDVYTLQRLDREFQERYQLSIRVIDSGIPSLSSAASVMVLVQDEIDDPPVFSQLNYTVFITTSQPANSALTRLSATTRDNVSMSSIEYTAVDGDNLFYIELHSGRVQSLFPIDPVVDRGVYTMEVRAQHHNLSSTASLFITVMRDDGIPRLRPLVIHFNAYPTLLNLENSLGVIQILQGKDSIYSFSLQHSEPIIHRYFKVAPSTGVLSVQNNVISGVYTLNVSVSTGTGVGYGRVLVYINLVSNVTLENSVVVSFGGGFEDNFAAAKLEQFRGFVANLLSASAEEVEIYGLQMNGDERLEVALAVRSPDHQTYVSASIVRGLLYANLDKFPYSSSIEVVIGSCFSNICPNLQMCQPLLHLLRYNNSIPLKIIQLTELIYHLHTFIHAHRCTCPPGYSRNDLCTEINECLPNPCKFGAVCRDLIGDYMCECPPATTGKNCSVICPSQSCTPCEPNPCLYGSICTPIPTLGTYTCSSCPWETHAGHNCELTSLYFTPGAFLAFPTLTATAGLSLEFSFATVSSNGLLLYNGQYSSLSDFIAVELVVGQVRVGVSFGGVATFLQTDSEQQLNDGAWHVVKIEIQRRVIGVNVSNCSRRRSVVSVHSSCHLHATLDPDDHRILDLTTPLYLGGVESRVSLFSPLSSVSFNGCISNLKLNQYLFDLNNPLRGEGTQPGCPPLSPERSCVQISCMRDCVDMWNGGRCIRESTRQVEFDFGFLHIGVGHITIGTFHMSIRTRSPNAVLVNFGGVATLELSQGNVVYRRANSSIYSALTIVAEAFVNDGQWHQIVLDAEEYLTMLSVDSGRIHSQLPQRGTVEIAFLTLGAMESSTNNSHFSGCMKDVIINRLSLNFTSLLAKQDAHFTIDHRGVVSGCGSGDPCSSVFCPMDSVCIERWRDYSCACDSSRSLVLRDGLCSNPCQPNPCQNSANCRPSNPEGHTPYICQCDGSHSGPLCATEGCSLGMFATPPLSCQQCLCDPEGVANGICDGRSGKCICQIGLHHFNKSGDLGCRPCDCDPVGAISPVCDEGSGQCRCRSNVIGRRCDRCQAGSGGMDMDGCRVASEVYGGFTLTAVPYRHSFTSISSADSRQLTSRLQSRLLSEMYQFGLPGLFQVSISSLTNRSGMVDAQFSVSSYLPRNSTHLTRPSKGDLAKVLQVILGSGQVGSYLVNSSFYSIEGMGEECPTGQHSDGLICRSPVSCSGGGDLDRDEVPDSCDSCPFVFNPQQTSDPCRVIEGICLGDIANGILWGAASVGTEDHKPCPSPLVGYTSRRCLSNLRWEEVNLIGCLSVKGQSLLAQVEAIKSGQILSLSELVGVADILLNFLSRERREDLFGGDVRVAGMLLSQLISQLENTMAVLGGDLNDVVQALTRGASNLLYSDLLPEWMCVVDIEGMEFDLNDFLFTLEWLSWVTGDYLGTSSSTELIQENLYIRREQLNDLQTMTFDLNFKETTSSISFDVDTVPLSVTFALFPTLGDLLPGRFMFAANRMIVATPILSVQTTDAVGSEVTNVPVKLTLEYGDHPERVFNAVCVSWVYQTGIRSQGGWSMEGCELDSTSSTHATCLCSHLTLFAVLLPLEAFQPFPAAYHLGVFAYIMFACSFLLLTTTLLFLLCMEAAQGMPNTVHKNLVLSLLLQTLSFIIFIDRTELEVVCGVLGVVLAFAMLAPIGWMLSDIILIARFLIKPSPKTTFVIYLYIIGWILPLLLCGVSLGTAVVVTGSFLDLFDYPEYCWLEESVVWVYVIPAITLLTLYCIGLSFSVVKLCQMSKSAGLNKGKIRSVLCISMVIVVLFVSCWGVAMVGFYRFSFMEYMHSLLHTSLSILIFLTLCLNKQMREAIQSKMRGKKEESETPTFMAGPLRNLYSHLRHYPPSHPPPSSHHMAQALRETSNTPSTFQQQFSINSFSSRPSTLQEEIDITSPPPHPPHPIPLQSLQDLPPPPPHPPHPIPLQSLQDLPPPPPLHLPPPSHLPPTPPISNQPWFADHSTPITMVTSSIEEDHSSHSSEFSGDKVVAEPMEGKDQAQAMEGGDRVRERGWAADVYLGEGHETEVEWSNQIGQTCTDSDYEDCLSMTTPSMSLLRQVSPQRTSPEENIEYSCETLDSQQREHGDPLWYQPRDSYLDPTEEAEGQDLLPFPYKTTIKACPSHMSTRPLPPLPDSVSTRFLSPSMSTRSLPPSVDPVSTRPLPPSADPVSARPLPPSADLASTRPLPPSADPTLLPGPITEWWTMTSHPTISTLNHSPNPLRSYERIHSVNTHGDHKHESAPNPLYTRISKTSKMSHPLQQSLTKERGRHGEERYHSAGTLQENQIIKHQDGSETLESLV